MMMMNHFGMICQTCCISFTIQIKTAALYSDERTETVVGYNYWYPLNLLQALDFEMQCLSYWE